MSGAIPRGMMPFIIESNRIEGITRAPTDEEIAAHKYLLDLDRLSVGSVGTFVLVVAGAKLRDTIGMDVRVGSHFPQRGGPAILNDLEFLLRQIQLGSLSPYKAHVKYETLHPFMDGNGRSGRALWMWQMRRAGLDPFELPFLHRFYYQSLEARQGLS